jgi:hypothetical protein
MDPYLIECYKSTTREGEGAYAVRRTQDTGCSFTNTAQLLPLAMMCCMIASVWGAWYVHIESIRGAWFRERGRMDSDEHEV